MYPTFSGSIRDGKLVIPDIDKRMKILEGKHIIIVGCDTDAENRVIGGQAVAGVYAKGRLQTLKEGKDPIRAFNGKNVFVIVRHDILAPLTGEAFDMRYQLGQHTGDMDN